MDRLDDAKSLRSRADNMGSAGGFGFRWRSEVGDFAAGWGLRWMLWASLEVGSFAGGSAFRWGSGA